MSINSAIEDAKARLESRISQVTVNSDALMAHMKRLIDEIHKDPEMKGAVVQIAMARPFGADNHVTSINIAGSTNDSQAAVNALARGPADDQRTQAALEIAARHGGTEEYHHQGWVVDQMVRALTGDKYEDWIKEVEQGLDQRS